VSLITDVAVDGEIDRGRRRRPHRRARLLAPAAGVALMAGLAWFTGGDGATGRPSRPSQPVPADHPTEGPAAEGPVGRAGGALSAWGRFAASGDLSLVDGWFLRDGPQHRALATEAPTLARAGRGPAYTVTTAGEGVVASAAGEAVVEATVTWSRAGEAARSFRWQIVMIRRQPREPWLVWTVRSAGSR